MNVAGLDEDDPLRRREHQTPDRKVALEPRPVLRTQAVVKARDARNRPRSGEGVDLFVDLPDPTEDAPDRLAEGGRGVLHALREMAEAAVPRVSPTRRDGATL